MDISLRDEIDQNGRRRKIIDFSSVLEKFDKKSIAQKKAKKYLSERLYSTMTSKKPKKIKMNVVTGTNKASNRFITSLANDYTKKQKDELSFEQKQKDLSISFTQKEIPSSLKNAILEILKNEYIYRIENQEKYPDFNYSISEIASEIEMKTRITPGQLYPILENISEGDIELDLIKNPDEPEDRRIKFFPIADDDISYALASFRPEVYKKIRVNVIKIFVKFLNTKKARAIFSKLRKEIGDETEEQKAWNSVYKIFDNYYPIYTEEVEMPIKGKGLMELINSFPKKDIDIYL
jgi:hypothetical protein